MEREICPRNLLNSAQILSLITRMLPQINPSLGKISCETVYISGAIVRGMGAASDFSLKDTLLLSLLHMVGFYHFYGENQIKLSDLTSDEIYHAYVYGYYYLKEMSPLKEAARTLLFYEKKYDSNLAKKINQIEYASLIFTAQAIQQLLKDTRCTYLASDFAGYGIAKFNSKYAGYFQKLDINKAISNKVRYESYLQDLDSWYKELDFTEEETNELFKLMIYLIDFKSTQTVQHIIHTAGYAVSIGDIMGCSIDDKNELYTAGFLHDLGKVSVPNAILEYPGKLTAFEYRVMQMHVEETENLLKNVVNEKLFNISVRHHEKLNGTGYPNRLTKKDLTIQERLMTIADILSALVDKRSYKEKLTKDEIIGVFKKLADEGAIEKNIPSFLDLHYDNIERHKEKYGTLLMVPLGLVEIQYQEEISGELVS